MLLRVAKHSITLTRYNYYNFLKLPQKAPPSQIQAAYFALHEKLTEEEDFHSLEKLERAFVILSDDEKRTKYDKFLTIQAAKGILRSSSGKVDPEEERTKEIMRKNYPDIEGRFAQKLENVDSVRANQANTEDTRVTLKEFKDNLKKGEEVKLEAFPFMHLVDKKKAKTLHKRTKFADLQADLKKDYRDLYCK